MRLAPLLALLSLPLSAAPLLYEPALSPDGRTLAFVSGGDIWTVPAAGGEARLLVSHPATESRPLWSPDGSKLAFASARSGNGDLYLLDLAANQLRRLSWDDRAEQPSGWSADGRWIYFHSVSHDIQRMNDVYRVSVDGGTPMPLAAQRYLDESQAAPSPDGRWLALNARAFGQWWRRGGAHIDQDELWLAPHDGAGDWRKLSQDGSRSSWPMWSADGRALWYVGNPGGQDNLYRRPLDGPAQRITGFGDGRVLWPSIAADGRTIAFERGYALWTLDTASGATRQIHVKLSGSGAAPAVERFAVGDKIEELRLSPDGKQLAFVARGEIWLAPAAGGAATRLTRTAAAEAQLDWSPDGRQLVYQSLRNGAGEIWRMELASRSESRVGAATASAATAADAFPRFSPDGRRVAWLRDGRALMVRELAGGAEKLLAKVRTGRPPIWADAPLAWAPDGQAIAVVELGERLLANVTRIALDGRAERLTAFASPGTGKKLWFRPEDQGYGQPVLQWRADGRVLWWRGFQHSEAGGRLVEIPLAPPAPLGADGEPQRTPFTVDAAWARSHAALLPIALDSQYFAAERDGKALALVGLVAGQANIWRWRPNELPRQLSFSNGTKHSLQLDADGRNAWYLDGGKLWTVALDDGAVPRAVALQAEAEVEFEADKQAVFAEAWQTLAEFFYDPAFHGQDWAALKARYAPWVAAAQSRDELRRVLWLMIGELDSSHTGLSAPRSETPTTLGRLAADFDRTAAERDGTLRLAAVVADGPAANAGLAAGDTLLAVDGETLARGDNLDRLLDGKIGKRVALAVAGRDGKPRTVWLKPVGFADEGTLRYRQWVAANRTEVRRLSGGKLDYLHLIDMRESSLDQFHLDLDAERQAAEGLVIDVRNNYGGMIDSWALDTLARRSHYSFTARALPTAPGRLAVGQQLLERPTVLLTNKITLSDGEVFTEGYRAMGLGRVVGEPGAGWVIFTSFKVLVDGSVLRLPFGRVLSTANGDDLESGPRPVDVAVPASIGTAGDAQLKAAVKVLLH